MKTKIEFFPGTAGSLCRVVRTPAKTLGHLLVISPLFEQANQIRHHLTKSSIHAYHRGLETIIFDHYGTGDSEGDLVEADLSLWQADIVKQIVEIRLISTQPIYLSAPLSAALLLSDKILKQVDGLMLLQPEFNGKRFVQQFKRLAMLSDLSQQNNVNDERVTEIAGYCMNQQLLADLAEQHINKLSPFKLTSYWFEWLASATALSPVRAKQQHLFTSKNPITSVLTIDDTKFWQATELLVSSTYLTQEKLAFVQLLAAKKALL